MLQYIKMTDKEVEDDAYTVMTYVTLSTLEAELDDVNEVIAGGEAYDGIYDVRRVLTKAIELIG